MATKAQVKQSVPFLAVVVETMPNLRVPLADLPLWAQVLDVDEMTVALRYDGRVRASVTKLFPEVDLLVVDTIADVALDLELPPCPDGNGFGESVRLPVDDLYRLTLFASTRPAAVKDEVA